MANFGWAYINCGTTGSANGPAGSVQFMSGSNESTGSLNLMYHTAAYASYAANTMVLSGTLVVSGAISASHVSASAFYGDGSNLTGIAGGGSPGGSDSQVQFNSGSSLGVVPTLCSSPLV